MIGQSLRRGPAAAGRWLGGRRLMLAAAIVFGCGLAVSGMVVFQAVGSVVGQYPSGDTPRQLAPGSTELQLAEPGAYTIYYEYNSTFQGTAFVTSPEIPLLNLRLSSPTSGKTVPVHEYQGTSAYRFGNVAGEAIGVFDIDRGGRYVLDARYRYETTGAEVVLAVAHAPPPVSIPLEATATALLLAGPATGLLILIRRRGASLPALTGLPGGPLPDGGTRAVGELSPDGSQYWDGARWTPALSPDRRWRWTGNGWVPASVTGPGPSTPFASPATRATVAITALGLAVLQRLLSSLLDAGVLPDDGVRTAVVVMASLLLLSFVAAAIAVPMWSHRAYRNLPAFGGLRSSFSTAMAAAGWFLPLVNLVLPYLVLREIWRRSRPGRERMVVLNVYWCAWVLGGGTGVFAFVYVNGVFLRLPPLLGDFALVPAGLLLMFVLGRVTRWQLERSRLAAAP
jgi:hypothetical protein